MHNKLKTTRNENKKQQQQIRRVVTFFHIWSSSFNQSQPKKRVKAVQEGQHLEMNRATRSHLAEPRRTAYLKAEVTKHRQLRAEHSQQYRTERWRQAPNTQKMTFKPNWTA